MIEAVIFDFGRVISAQKPMDLFRGYEEELGCHPVGSTVSCSAVRHGKKHCLVTRPWTSIGRR